MVDASEAPLWDELKAILRLAAEIFGEPARLLEDHVLPRGEARLLRAWLDALEAVARALLTAMAVRLPDPAPARAKATTARPRPPLHQDTDESAPPDEPPGSERWAGVVFRVAPGGRGGRSARGRRGGGPWRFLPTRALAYRFEALIRVAEAPQAYARRLARRLRAEPGLAARALARPARKEDAPPIYEDLVEEARLLARTALGAPAPDSG